MKFWLKLFYDKWIKRNCPHFCLGCKYRPDCLHFLKEDFKNGML